MSCERRALAGLSVVFATAGCPGQLADPALFLEGAEPPAALPDAAPATPALDGADCANVPQDVFGTTCTGASCHDSQYRAQGLDLQSPKLASRLVGAPSTEGPGFIIDPSRPSSSVLYTKLTASPPFGVRMPDGLVPLDDGTIACVLAWITRAASGPPASPNPEDAAAD